MAGDVGDMLHGFARPPERLRPQQTIRAFKTYTSDQTVHEGLLTGRITGGEAAFVVKGRADEGVADIVAERTYARHFIGPFLHSEVFVRVCRSHGSPPFTIGEDGGVDLIEGRTDGVHGLLVMDAHEVKTETIDVVLACPVANGLNHEAAVHLVVGSGLVAATGTVGVRTIFVEAVEILRHYASECATHDIVSVVVNDIHDDADTGFVERLDHLFRFANTASRIVGVGGITAFRYVVVHRIVAPVVAVDS